MVTAFFAMPNRCILLWLTGLLALPGLRVVAQENDAPTWADTTLAEQLIRRSGQLNGTEAHQEALDAALNAQRILTGLYGTQHFKTARAGMYVARELRELDREPEALLQITRCLPVFEQEGNVPWMARCHLHAGYCYREIFQFGEAHRRLTLALELMRPDSAGQASFLADLKLAHATIYIAEKHYAPAIPLLEEALAVYQDQNNARSIGYVNYHLGGVYFGLHDYVRAREYYLAALAQLKGLLPLSHSYIADLYVKIGLCFQQTGEPEIGLQYLLEAKEGYLTAGETGLNFIKFMRHLGRFYLDEHRYAEAVEQLELCLQAKERQYGASSSNLLITLLDLGEAYEQARQYGHAEACLRRGLDILASTTRESAKTASIFSSQMAGIRLALGDYAGCREWCDTAFEQAGFDPAYPEDFFPRDFGRTLCERYAQSLQGEYRLSGDTTLLHRANTFFALAARTLFREVEEIAVNSSREIFYDRDHQVLEQWLDVRMELYRATGNPAHAAEAFQIAVKGRAFLLHEAIQQSGALHFSGVPGSILEQERILQEQLASGEKAMGLFGFAAPEQADSATLWLNQALTAWRQDYDALLSQIRQKYPDYFRLRQLQPRISIADLRRQGLATDQALLLYCVAETCVYAFLVTQDTFCVATIPLNADLTNRIDRFAESVTGYFTLADPEDVVYDRCLEQYVALGQSLYQDLIGPVAPLLPARVVVIPEGRLCFLPFEALLSGPPSDMASFRTYPFWTREKGIAYALSPGFLIPSSRAEKEKPEKGWLGLAPFADSGNSEHHALPAEAGGFSALLFSGREVRTLAALLSGEAWVGSEARPGRFKAVAGQYRLLHLATHSKADTRRGNYSYLVTAQTGEQLPASDLYQMSLNADMVVLSACEAAAGKLRRGEGVIGLVRAFTYAGARSVVASQWVANDESTAVMMVEFYRNLLAGLPKDLALRAAREALILRHPAQAHPFFWAGFRVFGETGG